MALAGLSDWGSKYFSFLDSGVNRGLGSDQIIESFRAGGLETIRRTTMLADIRQVRGVEAQWSAIRYVGRERIVSEEHYAPAKKILLQRYQTVIELRGYSKETGESKVRHVTVLHDSLLRRNELENDAIKESEDVSPDFIITDVLPVQARSSLEW